MDCPCGDPRCLITRGLCIICGEPEHDGPCTREWPEKEWQGLIAIMKNDET